MSRTVIEVTKLVKSYQGREPILKEVTFNVLEKEFVAIQGKSGSGKTTLLNILGGLDRPTSGEVVIDGKSIVDLSEDELAGIRLSKIGFVFQDFNLLADLTVRENIALPLRFSRKRDGGRIEELMKKFGIDHLANEKAAKISGGEAQRTAIARAMINSPQIILADEPTGNLDAENTKSVIETFQIAIEDFGTTVILATHDDELAKHSTQKILLSLGKAGLDDANVSKLR